MARLRDIACSSQPLMMLERLNAISQIQLLSESLLQCEQEGGCKDL